MLSTSIRFSLPALTLMSVSLVAFGSLLAGCGEAGPQTPSCGLAEVTTDEVIADVQFPKGQYQINTFGMGCDEVMGEAGIFNQFLQLEDNEPLPAPWYHLSDAVGAPKFVQGPDIGFRAERVGD